MTRPRPQSKKSAKRPASRKTAAKKTATEKTAPATPEPLPSGAATVVVADQRGALERERLAPGGTAAAPAVRAAAAGPPPGANTVVFIHGIGNKPEPSILKCQWDSALFGMSMGDRTRMAYWVDRALYPTPLAATCASGDLVGDVEEGASAVGVRALAQAGLDPIEAEIEVLTSNPRQQELLRSIADKVQAAAEVDETVAVAEIRALDVGVRALPLPGFMRRFLTRHLTRLLLRDVNNFLFDEEKRVKMEDSLLQRLRAGGGPFVVVAHSQGTMIAWNVLRRLRKEDADVRLFVTVGSPLGLEEVQDQLKAFTGSKKLPFPPCVGKWVNVADLFDPVAFDSNLGGEFTGGQIENHRGFTIHPDSPRHPHSATGYLRSRPVQDAVMGVVGNSFAQEVGRFVVARDLVNNLENRPAEQRHPVLIQLADPDERNTLAQMREQLDGTIRDLVGERQLEDARIEPLKRFVSANLTRFEVESLRSRFRGLRIDHVWRDATKTALIYDSTHTVQARPANMGYGARGRDIRWAVLDTGIRQDHPHFRRHGNVVEQWDCTRRGEPKKVPDDVRPVVDGNGHGTHVAATIAGEYPDDGRPLPKDDKEVEHRYFGMAPEARLYGYKVLDDQGNGNDSWIIKALDHIADANERAGQLMIHGINLSLGGSFDPSVFGCGHSPLCQELRRLWRQGVLVCLAAGNEGFLVIEFAGGRVEANMDLSIGDPANLEEAIAVGSVHKTNPHTYGISYFSSRGPTADGRRKPDLVAPGEKVISASHVFAEKEEPRERDLYVEMSGTSMATPHVSGLLAAFLSVRREFIGYPDRVKKILLENCTDLARDPYMQGAGLPNLIKMLANT